MKNILSTLKHIRYLPPTWTGSRIELVFECSAGPSRVVVPRVVFCNWELLREAIQEQAGIVLPVAEYGVSPEQFAQAWQEFAERELELNAECN